MAIVTTATGLCLLEIFTILSMVTSQPPIYANYDNITSYLKNLNETKSHLVFLYSIGTSVQGRELWVMAIGSHPRSHVFLRPEVKFVGNMHGNEAVPREILLRFIDYVISAYGVDDGVTRLVNTTRLHVMISMNPDGFEKALRSRHEGLCTGSTGRFNANNIDLNRNFPDFFERTPTYNLSPELETIALMSWLHKRQFVLSANLHGGALVANYPYDNYVAAVAARPHLCADNDIFEHLALTYSLRHPRMHRAKPIASSFRNGTTNGAAWYPLAGGMQDYNYIYAGCMELTLEISQCKFPFRRKLSQLWEDNRISLMSFWAQVHRGVKGVVTDSFTGQPIVKAEIKVHNRSHGSVTTSLGEYWRLLLPGSYIIEVKATGYKTAIIPTIVLETEVTVLNISLYSSSTTPGLNSAPREKSVTASVPICSSSTQSSSFWTLYLLLYILSVVLGC